MNIALLEGAGNAGTMNMILIVAMIGVFYFFILRPQNKKRKELELMRESLAKGDKIIVNGIYGKILKIDGDEVTVELEEGRMKVHKSYVEAAPDATPAKDEN